MKKILLLLLAFVSVGLSQTISVGTLGTFGQVVVNTTSSEQTFTVSGTTFVAGDVITVTPPAGFEVSLTSGSGFAASVTTPAADEAGNISATTIYARFSPTATQAYTGNIVCSGPSASSQNVAVNGTGMATEPTGAPTVDSYSSVRATTIKINFTPGTGGSGRLVVVRSTSAVDFVPADGTTYTANTNFSLGSAVGTACKVVYNGAGSSVVVTNLSANTTYQVAVYEYNGTGTSINYLTTAGTGSQATTAAAALTGPSYTIGTEGDFPTLSGAIAELNTSGIAAPVVFSFLDASYTEPVDLWLGCAGTSASNTITFKPASGVTATIAFTQTTLHPLTATTGIDGHFVIASPTGTSDNLVSTNYVTIDGSNAGSTSKNLTITGVATASQKSVIRIYGNNDNITIKNCTITTGCTSGNSHGAIQGTVRFASSTHYCPDSLTIQNNTLTATSSNGANGIYLNNSGSATTGAVGLVIRDNVISGRTRGMYVSYNLGGKIFGNTIAVNSQTAQAAAGIALASNFAIAGTFDVYNNQFTALTTTGINASITASNGIIGIDDQNPSPKITNVYNNTFAGFNTSSGATNNKIYAIRHTTSGTTNVYNNTIYFADMTDAASGAPMIAGICFGTAAATEAAPTGTLNIKDNIVVSDESVMKVWAIRRVGTGGTVTSDYNNLKMNGAGYVGYDNATDQQTLANWQTATAKDANSKTVAVTFASATDLHLSGGSNGNHDLIGTPIGTVTTDIDGAARNATYPYMGADEASVALPVELTSFTANVRGTSVLLSWKTATETNNQGFDVERQIAGGSWMKIGFVEGAGSSNSPKAYQFVDAQAEGRVSYRLKQVDRDGGFTYSNVIEVSAVTAPAVYELAQNYPNPFNPSTTIRFAVKQSEHASLKVYDVAGREVAELFNDQAEAGKYYQVTFNAGSFASGMYIYVLQTPSHRDVKKMQLLK